MSLILVLKCFWSWYWIFKKKSNEPDTGIEIFWSWYWIFKKEIHMSLILVLKCFRRFNIGLFHYFMTTAMSQVSG